MRPFKRRDFIKVATTTGIGLSIATVTSGLPFSPDYNIESRRIGIIGLDTSHSVAFTKIFNDPQAGEDLGGYRVVAAYPQGSKDIKVSVDRIPEFTKSIQEYGVKIVSSLEELINSVDVVMLETNDGRLHLEQAIPVLKAGKRLFIDKPIAASFQDVISIYKSAKQYNVPVFTSSSLRYFENKKEIDLIGKVIGADTFSPATLEKTHSDLFWYGIHGVELLYTIMGPGCNSVTRIFTDDTDIVIGKWKDNRLGTFRGIRSGKKEYGGIVFGENNVINIVPGKDYGYRSLLKNVVQFFNTGNLPVPQTETLEIYTFMAAAEESSKNGGIAISLDSIMEKQK